MFRINFAEKVFYIISLVSFCSDTTSNASNLILNVDFVFTPSQCKYLLYWLMYSSIYVFFYLFICVSVFCLSQFRSILFSFSFVLSLARSLALLFSLDRSMIWVNIVNNHVLAILEASMYECVASLQWVRTLKFRTKNAEQYLWYDEDKV